MQWDTGDEVRLSYNIEPIGYNSHLEGGRNPHDRNTTMSRGATVGVSVRVRPVPAGCSDRDGAVSVDGATGGISVAGHASTWQYAQHLVTGTNQGVAYESLAVPLLAKLNQGFSCTMIAYGQTGSGKTHTM